ncbi:MAG: M20/M25/M40 family metallo-hydrolase [Sporomusaceae bacterium]|nr:M20/M25/M40 family metallo-hydrolase [Sporomusaceae bacterium]
MQEKMETLYQQCQEYVPDYMQLWETLVNIDTGTGYGEGISRVGNLAAAFLREQGATVRLVPSDKPDAGFNVVGVFTGRGRGKVLAMAHMDTVFAAGTAAERPFRTDGEWAYGPGVSDCKGSVALCLHAVKLLRQRQFDDFAQITCLFNCDEETGSPGSRQLIQELAAAHDVVLCLEPGQVGDGVVIWRKGSAVLEVAVHGRGSHAGSAPDDGRNALMELLQQGKAAK